MQKYELEPYLVDLESRIDDAGEAELYEQWRLFATGDFHGQLFAPQRQSKSAPGIEWPRIFVNDALDSIEAMTLQQLGACSAQLAGGGGGLMSVRSNYGSPIVPSIFGPELFRMEYDLDTLPCSHALSREALECAVARGVPDLHAGLGGAVFTAGQWFRDLFAGYPKIARHVHIYHPDTQGPMDICEMLRGSTIFEDAYDDPQFVHALLNLATDTLIAFLREWYDIIPPQTDGCAVHWGMLHGGTVMLRDDSAMNFSGAMFEEFIEPYDRRVLDAFGGGALHFCGRGDHYIARAASMPGALAFNMAQPHLNNVESVLQATVDHDIQLIGYNGAAARSLVEAGRDLHGNVHVW
ncbi:MAG: uroporphyrinogen decarboxylase family protein [Capsulimonadaceae bacterium]|nr:uroporphyrinogen decarboxylase family protein [Capsulimonadaceae bacterium]